MPKASPGQWQREHKGVGAWFGSKTNKLNALWRNFALDCGGLDTGTLGVALNDAQEALLNRLQTGQNFFFQSPCNTGKTTVFVKLAQVCNTTSNDAIENLRIVLILPYDSGGALAVLRHCRVSKICTTAELKKKTVAELKQMITSFTCKSGNYDVPLAKRKDDLVEQFVQLQGAPDRCFGNARLCCTWRMWVKLSQCATALLHSAQERIGCHWQRHDLQEHRHAI